MKGSTQTPPRNVGSGSWLSQHSQGSAVPSCSRRGSALACWVQVSSWAPCGPSARLAMPCRAMPAARRHCRRPRPLTMAATTCVHSRCHASCAGEGAACQPAMACNSADRRAATGVSRTACARCAASSSGVASTSRASRRASSRASSDGSSGHRRRSRVNVCGSGASGRQRSVAGRDVVLYSWTGTQRCCVASFAAAISRGCRDVTGSARSCPRPASPRGSTTRGSPDHPLHGPGRTER